MRVLTSLFLLIISVVFTNELYAACVVETTGSYAEGTNLRDDKCDTGGNKKVSLGTLLSGEDQANNLIMTSGGAVRTVTLMSAVTTDTTGDAVVVFSGGKTGLATVTGTGSVSVDIEIFGDMDDDAAGGESVCTIGLSGTDKDMGSCAQWAKDYPYYYATTDNISGTGASVDVVIAVGAAAAGSGGGGGGDASAANQTTLIGHVDGLEGLLSTSNTNTGNIATYNQPGTNVIIRSDNTNNDDKTQIKATAGVLLWISGRNAHATTAAYVRCTNATAANTTPGSTAVIYEMIIPPATSGFIQGTLGPGGMTFDTALTCYVATGKAVSDTTDAGQDDVVVNVGYR